MSYLVKEIFLSLQGEGANTGRTAVLCRFAGCNLWSGRELDRAKAICQFCDTDFVGLDGTKGGHYQAQQLADAVSAYWPEGAGHRLVICTGGEPLLQLDEQLIVAFHQQQFEVAVETNGTLTAPAGIDWLCVSPKAGTELVVKAGDELKLVYPQADAPPEQFANLDFRWFFLQPMDNDQADKNQQQAIAYCLTHPQWRLSLQTHKFIGLR